MYILVEMIFGSHLYGTETPHSDKDYKGIFLPTKQEVYLQRVPHSISRSTKKQSEHKNTVNDIDSEFYSLHYFIELACKGETVALDMLHAPLSLCSTTSPVWEQLVAQKERFYTRNLKAFVGYARRQAAKYGVKGSRLAEAKKVRDFLQAQSSLTRLIEVWDKLPTGEHIHFSKNDVDLLYEVCGKKLTSRGHCSRYLSMLEHFIENYGDRARLAEANEGVDWKAVSHAFRAAYQVRHILLYGGYTYPLPETEYIKAVKQGTLHYTKEVGPKLDSLMEELEALSAGSTLPETVEREYWDTWLFNTLEDYYGKG